MNKSTGRNPSPVVRQHIQLLPGRSPKCHAKSPDIPGVCHISPAHGDTRMGRLWVKLGETRFVCSKTLQVVPVAGGKAVPALPGCTSTPFPVFPWRQKYCTRPAPVEPTMHRHAKRAGNALLICQPPGPALRPPPAHPPRVHHHLLCPGETHPLSPPAG